MTGPVSARDQLPVLSAQQLTKRDTALPADQIEDGGFKTIIKPARRKRQRLHVPIRRIRAGQPPRDFHYGLDGHSPVKLPDPRRAVIRLNPDDQFGNLIKLHAPGRAAAEGQHVQRMVQFGAVHAVGPGPDHHLVEQNTGDFHVSVRCPTKARSFPHQ